MKTKLVLWGNDAKEERVLIAMELRPELNQVGMWLFPEEIATDDFAQQLFDEWRDSKEVPFPEGFTYSESELTMTEGLLPEEIKVERGDIVQRAQAEWHFIVLSSKLKEAYHSELDELKERVERLEAFDEGVWENLKGFWNKVQNQVRERNLFRDHIDSLRENTNKLFDRLKELRKKMDEQFSKQSKVTMQKFMGSLEEIDKKVEEGLRLQSAFDELKRIQRDYRDAKMTRDHRSKVWDRLDGAFKAVKEKRFGKEASRDDSPLMRIKRRYAGLMEAIGKMDRSIQRDKDDLNFQHKKIATTDGQLEAQIRQAKIKMIEERINSKEEKLKEMVHTRTELEGRMEQMKQREAMQAEKERLIEAKKLAKEKIAEKIKHDVAAREDIADKLEKAADSITPEKEEAPAIEEEKEPKKKGGLMEAIVDKVEDAVDSAKAVAEVVADKVEDAVEDAKVVAGKVADKVEDKIEELKGSEKKEEASLAKAPAAKEAEEPKGLIEKIADNVEDAVDTAKELAGKVADKVEDVVEDAVDSAKIVAGKVADKVEDTVENLKGTEEKEEASEGKAPKPKKAKTSKKKASLMDTISDKVEDAVDAAKEVAGKVTDKVEDVIEDLTEKEEKEETPKKAKASKKKAGLKGAIADKMEDAVDAAKEMAEKVADKVEDVVEDLSGSEEKEEAKEEAEKKGKTKKKDEEDK